jgi:thioredoxin 1
MAAKQITEKEFEKEVLQSEIPVLVDFWATWCGPCQMLSPVISEISDEAEGFKVIGLDVDKSTDIARKYKVFSIPTLLVFRDGEPVKRSVGVISKDEILEMVK